MTSTKKPIIGITLDLTKDSAKYSYSAMPWYAVRACYSNCVTAAGGMPILLPYHQDLDGVLDLIDGLIITGSDEDINPKFYGQDIISNLVKTNDPRAKFELELTQKAADRNMPVFGICNGLQVINTIYGGTLIQHIPDVLKSEINHEQSAPKNIPSHSIDIKEGTMLADLTNQHTLNVNSTHHQAIDKLGRGLIVSATAPDGIIEAIESPTHRFLVGVQWHSEYLNSELDEKLFKRLIEECSIVI